MNDQLCERCVHYDRIVLGRGTRSGRHGWCAVRSVYPAEEGPGHVFPLRVRRAPPGALAAPHIVRGDEAVTSCTAFQGKESR